MSRVGLFGGTFDPVHVGHIAIAEVAKERMKLDRVIFIPAGDPPHKTDKKVSGKEDRFAMLRLAISGREGFSISRYELDKKERSYSLNLIKHFKEELKDDELFFIIGADSFYNLPTWYRYEELMEITNFIVISRPQIKKESLLDKFNGNEKPMRAFFIDDVSIPVSATQIREKLKNGEDAFKYLDKSVLSYITTRSLYEYSTDEGKAKKCSF